jgi:hypothetical protein
MNRDSKTTKDHQAASEWALGEAEWTKALQKFYTMGSISIVEPAHLKADLLLLSNGAS